MKTTVVLFLFIFIAFTGFAQSTMKVTSFKVNGVCEMCKKTIENALHIESVKAVNWNPDTKIIKVKFDESKISLDSIHRRIIAVGYDTDKYSANDTAYATLHKCCKYERKTK
jgi:copper chaperone CopZ